MKKLKIEIVVKQVNGRPGDQVLYPHLTLTREEAFAFYREIETVVKKYVTISK